MAACTSGPRINGLATEAPALNQYFDRLSEFVDNGSHENYLDLLGFNFQDAKHLLMSTNPYFFGAVGANYSKVRRFVIINPFDIPVANIKYSIVGSPFIVLETGTCGTELKPFQVCTISIKFYPNSKGAIETVVGLHKAELVMTYPGGPVLKKPLSGQAIP